MKDFPFFAIITSGDLMGLEMDTTDITLLVLAGVVLANTIAQFFYAKRAERTYKSGVPAPSLIISVRVEVQNRQQLTVEQAQKWCADAIFIEADLWVAWEAGEKEIVPALWDLFLLRKTEIEK